MALTDRLATPPERRPGTSIMDTWINTLPQDEANAVRRAVTDPAWGHTALLTALTEEGAPAIADTTFATWRRKHGLKR